jgi:uncharacterized protein (TIGR02246 family)
MRHRIIASAVIIFGASVTLVHGDRVQPPATPSVPVVAAVPPDGDRDAILKSARDYETAFNKSDAKAVAALWTENGECREATGQTFTGRAAIEQAYAEFFKANPNARIDVLVKSIRFPAKDMAVEEGLVRQMRSPKDLPGSTSYVVVHIREGGQWKIALSSEGGVGQDRLEDLDWLIGDWSTKVSNGTVTLSFARDPKKPAIKGTFTRTPAGKEPLTGTVHIALDPETGRIRSWAFEDDGAHSQSLWTCDGKSWILDFKGVLADGTPTAERIIIQRVAPDTLTWRAIDRVLDGNALPDLPPMRLTRKPAAK